MKAVIQRVDSASVSVEGREVSRINRGLLVLLGVCAGDTSEQADKMAKKLSEMRIFPDAALNMNLSIMDVKGEMLVVSQFTLCADTVKGRRPSFTNAAPPDIANNLYELTVEKISALGIPAQKGVFGAMMKVQLVNDGPVTFTLDVY